jgi:endonuclease/exonuclease/phosphatase family metal-dependent hydrolase
MKILTLNLRHHRDRWDERLPLVVDVLRTHRPDIICFQEVWMPIQQADTILKQLSDDESMPLYALPKQGRHGQEGIAIASRYPVIGQDTLNLYGGERVAQSLLLDINGTPLCIANTHLHDKPVDESIRLPQMQELLQWLAKVNYPTILAGDMNAYPESTTITAAKSKYLSTYEVIHGSEPDVTFPTPLVADNDPNEEDVVIDYIFFSSDTLRVIDVSIVADIAHPNDETLYPSDHYGILASIESRRVKKP